METTGNNEAPMSIRGCEEKTKALEFAKGTTHTRCGKMATEECLKCKGYCDFRSRYESFIEGWNAKAAAYKAE